jgi:hypothetical protein
MTYTYEHLPQQRSGGGREGEHPTARKRIVCGEIKRVRELFGFKHPF